jgi:large subunit ribosomal protein L22
MLKCLNEIMPITAKLKYLRIAPRKVRLVADLIRGKKVEEAQNVLNFTIKKSAAPVNKLLKSSLDNAKNNFKLDSSNLYISKITVDEGPKYKRWRARSRGQAFGIQKKTSHITIVLDEIIKKQKKVKKTKKARSEIVKRIKKVSKIEKPKTRAEREISEPKIKRGMKRVFRRKAFG